MMMALKQAQTDVLPSTRGAAIPMRAPRILNHDIMGCTAEGVHGNHLYSGRALGMTEPEDIIQLHPDLRPQWPYISEHYERVGLSYTDQVLWHVEHEGLSNHPDRDVSVFYFGVDEQAARPDDEWFRVVDYINSKNNFMTLAESLGTPVPMTRCYNDAADIHKADIAGFDYPCYLKAAVSVSGVGIYRCADAADMQDALGRFAPGVPIQVQAEVVSDCFLNLQYQADERACYRLAATEQVLDGPVHQGNRYPARYTPWNSVEPMAKWLYQRGMRGVFAFDVAVIDTPSGIEYQAIECNPRYNGASYPTAVAKKLDIEQWLARTFKTRFRSLEEVELGGLEYDQSTGEGVILINWGPILVGKLLCLLAGSRSTQKRLELELQARL